MTYEELKALITKLDAAETRMKAQWAAAENEFGNNQHNFTDPEYLRLRLEIEKVSPDIMRKLMLVAESAIRYKDSLYLGKHDENAAWFDLMNAIDEVRAKQQDG